MKIHKWSILFIVAIILTTIFTLIPNNSKAATLQPPIYLGIQEYRTNTDPENMAYGIGNPDRNGSTTDTIVGAKIWDIVKYNSLDDNQYDNTINYYCVKAGVGFRNTGDKATYNVSYDFKKDRDEILSSNNKYLKSIVNTDNNTYYNIMALADLMYLPGVSTQQEKEALIKASGILSEEYPVQIKDSDIEAIQQAALWYFTNYDDELFDKIYNQYGKVDDNATWFTYKLPEMEDYHSLRDYQNPGQTQEGEQREKQAIAIYNYLIKTAMEKGQEYKKGTAESLTKITLYANSTVEETQPVILIERVKPEGEYNIQLVKVDSESKSTKLSGAKFKVTLADGSSKEYTTNDKGEISISKIAIEETGTDVITIEEIEPPAGYNKIIDSVQIKITKTLEGVKYVPSNAEIVNSSEAKGTEISLNKESGTIVVTVPNDKKEGSYDIQLVKVDKTDTSKKLSGAKFKVTLASGESKEYVTDSEGKISISNILINETGTDTITIQEIEAPKGYKKIIDTLKLIVTKGMEGTKYVVTDVKFSDDTVSNGSKVTLQGNTIMVEVPNIAEQFDLKLIKRIVEVNSQPVKERLESVDVSKLADGTETTADYKMNKNPVAVRQGDIVKYTLRVYNEGEIDGYASEISEDIPEGLEFLWSEKDGEELENDNSLSEQEKEAIKYNQGIWNIKNIDTETNRVEMITTDYLAKGKGAEVVTDGANLIKAFDSKKGYVDTDTDKNPDYKEVSVYLKVVAENETGLVIRNEAAITGDTDSEGNPVDDRDSNPDNWVKYEDDEDYDNVELKIFDLALRKFIIAVSPTTTVNDEDYLKNEDGTYERAPQVDTSKLDTKDENGNIITTAIYNHTKEPVEVNKNDYVIYMLRVYNEGDIDGYATEITDYLPSGLEFVDGEFNDKYGWKLAEDGKQKVTTNYLENSIIKGVKEEEGEKVLSYVEVPIMCKVVDNVEYNVNQTNIAEITEAKDENKEDVVDRDSEEGNVVIPSEEQLPSYKDDEKENYVPGQQDDDDFEKVYVKPFDLALRKFITGLNDQDITNRIPQLSYNEEEGKITYNHTKDPVEVVNGDTVIYTIRVYNEGEKAGYAEEVADDIPEKLEFLPDNELNKQYRWKMYDAEGNETDDISKAEKIVTDYLSKANGEEMMKDESSNENPNLLKPFDKEQGINDSNPDYRDVKVAFKVVVPDRSEEVIINSAQIQEDSDENGNPIDDIDSTPGEWNDGEDDQDKEYIKPGYFDLALRKWVTEAIVIEDGKQTVTQTGHTPEQDPEPVVKVEIHRNKLNKVTIKFRYSIRVTNEGTIAGYAKEITDYVPQGLKFVAEDNPGWTDEGNNVISTRLLENTLLQPGEHADVEVLLTWINGENNMGLMTNIAEISEDYNDKGVPDIDSTPDNKKEGEDDIDDAPVIVSISTGQARIYYTLGFVVLITIAGGIILIKKYVL